MRTTARCLIVWGMATGAAALLLTWLVPGLTLHETEVLVDDFESLLVSGCGLAGAACTIWLWALATLVVAEGVRGRVMGAGVPTVVRRVVLALCGLSLAGGLVVPAHADRHAPPPESASAIQSLLVGLPVPDRTTSTTEWLGVVARSGSTRESSFAEASDEVIRVETGDTLWGLAEATLPGGATAAEIDRRWRAIYRANLDAIGADPDLIRPGQRLLLPATGTGRR